MIQFVILWTPVARGSPLGLMIERMGVAGYCRRGQDVADSDQSQEGYTRDGPPQSGSEKGGAGGSGGVVRGNGFTIEGVVEQAEALRDDEVDCEIRAVHQCVNDGSKSEKPKASQDQHTWTEEEFRVEAFEKLADSNLTDQQRDQMAKLMRKYKELWTKPRLRTVKRVVLPSN